MTTFRILLERAGQKWDTGITVEAESLIQAAKAMDAPDLRGQLHRTLETFLTLEKVPEGVLPGLDLGGGNGHTPPAPSQPEAKPKPPMIPNPCTCWNLDGGFPPFDDGAQRSAGRGFSKGLQGGQKHSRGSAGCHNK